MVEGSVCTKFQVCIVFRLIRKFRTTHNSTDIYKSELKKNTLSLRNVDFDYVR